MACCCDNSPNCGCGQCAVADGGNVGRHPTVTASGFSGDCAQFNGSFVLNYVPTKGCYWSAPVGTGEIRVYAENGGEGTFCLAGTYCWHIKFLSPNSTVLYTKINDGNGRAHIFCEGDGTSGDWSSFEFDTATGAGCTAHPANVTFKPDNATCEDCCCQNRDMPSSITLTMSSACALLNIGSVTMNYVGCTSNSATYRYSTANLTLELQCVATCTVTPVSYDLVMTCNGGGTASGDGCCAAAPNCQPFSGSGTLTVYASPNCCMAGQTASFSFHE